MFEEMERASYDENDQVYIVCSFKQARIIGLTEEYIRGLPLSPDLYGAVVLKNEHGQAHIIVPWLLED